MLAMGEVQTSDFTLKLHDMGFFVVPKEFFNVQPYLTSLNIGFDNCVDKILRHCHVKPCTNHNINLFPFGFNGFGSCLIICIINMIKCIICFTVSGEQHASCIIVMAIYIKKNRDVGFDVGDNKDFVRGRVYMIFANHCRG